MKKLVKSLDPKLERYREKPEELKPEEPPEPEKSQEELPTYSPKTLKAFLQIIKNTPLDVLSSEDRSTIASAISFRERRVESIMLPRQKITFVYEHDFLGPLMLDKLYQSGHSHFPVLSSDGRRVIGILHTASLNSLETRTNERAGKYLDKRVCYLRTEYTLDQAMAAFLRTNSFFFVVIDGQGKTVGLLTYKMLVSQLLGYDPTDDFDEDTNLAAVMKRRLRSEASIATALASNPPAPASHDSQAPSQSIPALHDPQISPDSQATDPQPNSQPDSNSETTPQADN